MESVEMTYLEKRKLIKRWKGPIPALVNVAFMAVIFYISWWIFQDPRGIMRMYTPYVGYMVCRWMLIMFIWIAYIFDFWPFKRSWVRNTHPLVKGSVLTLVSVAIMIVLIKGFFEGILGHLGIAYFSPEVLTKLGVVEFYAIEYAAEAIMMFAAISSWLSPSWVVACENSPWDKMKQPARGLSVIIITFLLSMIVYFCTMHSHLAILFYPWQKFAAICPPYWESFANTVSGNFHIAWIMCGTVIVWLFESTFERYPFNLIKTDWIRRVASFFGILIMAVCLAFFLYFVQELVWGPAIRGTRRLMAPDWRWLHVGEMAIFWLVPCLFIAFYCDNWPKKYSRPVNIIVRCVVTILATCVLYWVYYKTAHLFLGTQKGFSHPQQFPMIPMIWLINIFLINHWFMDNWPGWKLSPEENVEIEGENRAVATDVKWSKKLGQGIAVGIVAGVVIYLIIIQLLPWLGNVFSVYN